MKKGSSRLITNLEYKVKDKGYSLSYEILFPDNPKESPYISITGYTPDYPVSNFAKHGELTIPSKIDGYEVKDIAHAAFYKDDNIKTVVLLDTVKVLC